MGTGNGDEGEGKGTGKGESGTKTGTRITQATALSMPAETTATATATRGDITMPELYPTPAKRQATLKMRAPIYWAFTDTVPMEYLLLAKVAVQT